MNPDDAAPANPFPGLRSFRSDEHHLFFGREEQTAALLQRLRNNRFIAVVGTSGSGKSSLVRAGMIAELHGGAMMHAGSSWEVMVLRPGGNPVENLARAFVDAQLYDAEDASTLPRLLATLNRSRFGLVEAMKQSGVLDPGTNLLVVVDQFEELFRFRQQGIDSEETAAAFVNLLLTASEQAECGIYVAITIRSDYLGDCSEIPGLAEAVNKGEYLIPRLSRDQKRDAIEKPIGVGGAKISPLLVQRLLNDVGDDPDQLPVLQHALMRMWDAWSAGGDVKRPIELGDFEATGGLASALSNHADEVYDALADDRHRAACEKIFKALTEKGDDNRGIRRPTRLMQLQAIAHAPRETVTAVLDAFRGAGVTLLMPGSDWGLTDRTVLDLSHESLMRCWQRLRGWVEQEAQSARIFRRLLDTARLWGDGKAGLFRDPDLQIALSWREQESPNADWSEQYGGHFDTAIKFLEASNAETQAEIRAAELARQRELDQARQFAEAQQLRLEQQQRAARKLRRLIAGLAVVALIAGLACVAALVLRQRAAESALAASNERDKAQAAQQQVEKLAAQANADRDIAQHESYRSTIRLAESMLEGDDHSKFLVADLLWGAQPELRGWEWGYLMARCPLEDWSLQTDQGGLDVLAASLDGRYLATAGLDGTVALWDSWTRKQLWRQKTGRVRSLSFDPQGRYIVMSSADEAKPFTGILDFATGKVVQQASIKEVATVAFSPSGRDFYVCSNSTLARYNGQHWNPFVPVAVTPLAPLAPELQLRRKIFVDEAGAYVGFHDCPGLNNTVGFLFDAQTLRPSTALDPINAAMPQLNLGSLSNPCLHSGTGMMVYTEGPLVFEDGLDQSGRSTGVRQLLEHPTVVGFLACDLRSQTIMAASSDGTITFLGSNGKIQTSWHGAPLNGLALLPDGRFITGGADGLLKCWKLDQKTALAANVGGAPTSASATILAFAGDRLLLQTWERNLHFLIDLTQQQSLPFNRPEVGEYGPHLPVIRPQTNELVVNTATHLAFYDLPKDDPAGLKMNGQPIDVSGAYGVAFDASGRLMVVSQTDGQVSGFDLKTRQPLAAAEARGKGAVAVNSAGTRAALLTESGLQVWDIASGHLLQRVEYTSGARPIVDAGTLNVHPVFHPDGELVAFTEKSENGCNVVLWDTTLGRRRATIKGDPGIAFYSCLFSKDGSRILVPCSDAKVRIWDWRLGKEVLALSGAKLTAHVAESTDGFTIAYAGWDPTLCVARALPFGGTTQRDLSFYSALDDFRKYTMGLPSLTIDRADKAEWSGDIHLRRGEAGTAQSSYAEAIRLLLPTALAASTGPEPRRRLAALYEKEYAAGESGKAGGGTHALQEAVDFWQELPSNSATQPYLLDAQLRLVDRRLAQDEKNGMTFLQSLLEPWVQRAEKREAGQFDLYGSREMVARLFWFAQAHGRQDAIDDLLKQHPSLASDVGDLCAADQNWNQVFAVYGKAIVDSPADADLISRFARTCETNGHTRDALPYLAKASEADPKDTMLAMNVAALQAWFGQDKELGATQQRILDFARDTKVASTASCTSKACTLFPSKDKAEVAQALSLAQTSVTLEPGGMVDVLALGMAQYRSGDATAAEATLLAAVKIGSTNPSLVVVSDFYRAMSLFGQGKKDQARELAITASATMKPLPRDENNPLANGADQDDLIMWLAYKEAKAMIQFNEARAAQTSPSGK